MSGRSYALKPASLDAIARKPARVDLGVLLQQAHGAFVAWCRVGRERIELLDASARVLRDIGLTRADSGASRERVFWRI
jgi:uncharacterized protein YjiS (DUF1127 family)